MAHPLVHLNATLNLLATVLLVVGFWHIRRGRERAHAKAMLAAFVVSCVFLVSYLVYHAIAGSVKFTHEGPVRYVYYGILLTHVVLAAAVPFLAVATIWQGWKATGWWSGEPASGEVATRYRVRHRRLGWQVQTPSGNWIWCS